VLQQQAEAVARQDLLSSSNSSSRLFLLQMQCLWQQQL
jgi:hypothetical protein